MSMIDGYELEILQDKAAAFNKIKAHIAACPLRWMDGGLREPMHPVKPFGHQYAEWLEELEKMTNG